MQDIDNKSKELSEKENCNQEITVSNKIMSIVIDGVVIPYEAIKKST